MEKDLTPNRLEGMVAQCGTAAFPVIQTRKETGMKSQTEYLTFNIPQRMDFVNITPEVKQVVRASGVQEGLCLVNTK